MGRRHITFAILFVLAFVGLARSAPTTTPPSGVEFPPPAGVTKWTIDTNDVMYSYTYKGHKLLGPFIKTQNTKDAKSCFNACYDYRPKNPDGQYCSAWTWKSGKCSLSPKSGCTVYNAFPQKECVLWDKDAKSTSGWVAVPLQ